MSSFARTKSGGGDIAPVHPPMKSMRRSILLLFCGFFAGGLAGSHALDGVIAKTVRSTVQNSLDRVPISQSTQWVAFTADLIHRGDDGHSLRGRFMRGSDGSIRQEMSLDTDPNLSKIVISNFSKRVYYSGLSDGSKSWLSGPLGYPDIALAPPRWTTGVIGLSPYRYKLALLKGQDGSLKSADGLDAWIYTNDTGTMRLMVPALNFYPVVNSPITGRRDALSNIVIGPVDKGMFEPPQGVAVTWRQTSITGETEPGPADLAKTRQRK